jgi:hypothetical protein
MTEVVSSVSLIPRILVRGASDSADTTNVLYSTSICASKPLILLYWGNNDLPESFSGIAKLPAIQHCYRGKAFKLWYLF